MTKPKDKFGVRLLIDDKTYKAIGLVAAQWAFLEIEFDRFLNQLILHPLVIPLGIGNVPQQFARRVKLFKRCAEAVLHDQPSLKNELIAIINDASSARGQRDDVIHGQWHLGRKKGNIGAAVTIVKSQSKIKVTVKNMSSDQIESVAVLISKISARLIWWKEMNVTFASEHD